MACLFLRFPMELQQIEGMGQAPDQADFGEFKGALCHPREELENRGTVEHCGGQPGPERRTSDVRCQVTRKSMWILVQVSLGVAYFAYLLCAVILDWRRALLLVILTLLVVLWKLTATFWDSWCRILPFQRWYRAKQLYVWGAVMLAVFCVAAVVTVFSAVKHPRRLLALGGLAFNMLIAYVCSTNRRAIQWKPVAWGLLLQVAIALFVLRTRPGLWFFEAAGDLINKCLDFADVGAKFLFGDNFTDHFMAFKVLPAITFFSALISVLYYFGIMQAIIRACAAVLTETMGLSPCETLVAAGNIFVGCNTAPLLVKPLLPLMTRSELHSIMTTGFATIAGNMLAVYGAIDIPMSHLVGASVMSAPAALAISKVMCPEEQTPTSLKEWSMRSNAGCVVEAIAQGAVDSISIIAYIAVMLLAFVSFIALGNALLSWLGGMVGYPELSFDKICAVVFLPFAFLMGVQWKDCSAVASLLGTKTIINEFVAYTSLSQMIAAKALEKHSVVVATYALCGFSNFGALGSTIGCLSMLVPGRLGEISSLAPRALIGGTLACFATACVAGLIYE